MVNTVLYKMLLPFMIVIISFSSIYLDRTDHAFIMVATGIVMFFAFNAKQSSHKSIYLQMAALLLFHWLSQLNWCLMIYVMLLIRQLIRSDNLIRAIISTFFIMILYSVIRFSYSPINDYAILVTFSDSASALIFVALIWKIKSNEQEKEKLEKKNNELLKKDVLTGLLNYHEFRKELIRMNARSEICFIILNCQDLRSVNFQHGYEQANMGLKEIARELDTRFSSSLVCRYGGSEFAIAMEIGNERTPEVRAIQAVDDIILHYPNLDLIYAYACSNGRAPSETIEDVENQLFMQKKEIWVNRDEHIFRADKLKVIGELAAGMAHEIRNPLTTIKGFLQLAYQNEYKDIVRYHPMIMDEITRVSELTSEFLQFSKPNLSQVKTEAIEACIARAVSIMGTEIERKGHELHVEYAGHSFSVNVERDKIVQVLVNLFKNSIDAMEDLGRIGVKVYGIDKLVYIEVSDTGTGMSDAAKDKIFEPFFTTKGHGTGLGLSISHKIIHDHGGRMEVVKTGPTGTVFSISLPIAPEPE
ncbi:diguanylate cyclase [Paenibacillus rhizovicinus]|uniref:histidine kinase n=1 Tax=Paenibacillus rhizovicinus TaxID=2704463 RepID=A0A6C0P930_9BACL|nr:ATP-binding protein [Paenibacillus rhizovicinus]QHW33042.1 diguanylate cyclase [Paenibacillus rhizovicinus]